MPLFKSRCSMIRRGVTETQTVLELSHSRRRYLKIISAKFSDDVSIEAIKSHCKRLSKYLSWGISFFE